MSDDDQKQQQQKHNLMDDEDPVSPAGRVMWSSYVNLAKMTFEVKTKAKRLTLKEFMKFRCTATEKIDGSNLGCYIRHVAGAGDVADPEAWECLLLQGRNAALYASASYQALLAEAEAEDEEEGGGDDDDGKQQQEQKDAAALKKDIEAGMKKCCSLPGYGNAGSLGALPRKMRAFAVRLAQQLGGIRSIQVFGEAFRARTLQDKPGGGGGKIEVMAPYACFNPFGVKLPESGWQLLRLNKQLHDMFCVAAAAGDSSVVFPKNHEEFTQMLIAATDNMVVPPPLYAGAEPLIDVVERLSPLFIASTSRYFEGVFVVFEDHNGGFKYKTGTHDEQSSVATAEQLGLVQEPGAEEDKELSRIAAAWTLIENVRKVKIAAEKFTKAAPAADPGKAAKAALDAKCVADITTATTHEFGKMATFSHVPRDKRGPICDTMLPLVLKEVMKNYTESGVPLPYAETLLKAKAIGTIKNLVLKVQFDEAAAAAVAAAE